MGVRIALLALALVLAAAAPASARTLERKSLNGEQQLVFTSDFSAVGENLVVAGVTGTLQLDFNNSADAFSGPAPSGCAPLSIHLLRCDRQVTQRMTVFLGERDDVWRSFVTIPTTVHGNVGDDWLDSRSAPDTLLGEAGHDLIADDPDVADSDTMTGGAGDDVIVNGLGADDIRGGEGIDSVSLGSTNDLVTLDDVANDGGASGEGDNIRSDVENLDGGGGNDRLAGDGDANRLEGGPGADELFGGGGADDLIGGAGADVLFGGRTLIARHTLRPRAWRCRSALTSAFTLDDVADDGTVGEGDNVRSDIEDVAAGAGNDIVLGNEIANTLDGGAGDDDVTGGGGDILFGGPGLDVLRARDGVADRAECNADGGSAIADTIDAVLGCAPVDVSDALVPDVDGDGATKPGDCDDHNAAVRPGAVDVFENGVDENCDGIDAINLDRDGDGHRRPSDCDDANRIVHPGARDVPGNKLDEDCSGRAEPFPRVASTVRSFLAFPPLRFTTLTIVKAVKGSQITLRCRGGGCFKRKTIAVRASRATLSLTRHVRGVRLRRGAVVEIRITKPSHVGVVRRVTARGGSSPPEDPGFLPAGR